MRVHRMIHFRPNFSILWTRIHDTEIESICQFLHMYGSTTGGAVWVGRVSDISPLHFIVILIPNIVACGGAFTHQFSVVVARILEPILCNMGKYLTQILMRCRIKICIHFYIDPVYVILLYIIMLFLSHSDTQTHDTFADKRFWHIWYAPRPCFRHAMTLILCLFLTHFL